MIRRILFALVALLLAAPASGQDFVYFKKKAAAAGASYLLQEDFEGPGYTSGTWTETGTTIDDQYATSPAPLVGSYSLYMNPTGTFRSTASPTFTAQDTVYIYFQIRFTFVNDTANQIGVFSANSGINVYQKSNKFYMNADTGTAVAGATTLDAATTYHVWLQYTKGTGADAVGKMWLAATATKPGGTEISITNGAATTQVNSVTFKSTLNTYHADFIIDKIRVSATEIGSDPS